MQKWAELVDGAQCYFLKSDLSTELRWGFSSLDLSSVR